MEKTYSDNEKDRVLPWLAGLVKPSKPGEPFDMSPPRLKEVYSVIKKARSASAPGANGVSFKVFKNCPQLVRKLWKLLCVAWNNEIIVPSWNKAEGLYLPKEEKSVGIGAFRPISLLNVDGKVFFGVIASRLTKYLINNGYIDRSVQKAGIPGSPGCIEHAAMIWHTIQSAKREKSDLSVLWLDLANAYGAVPHAMIRFAMEFFYIPEKLQRIVLSYYNSFQMRFSTQHYTTNYQALQVGIPMGCTVSPILFVMSMELMIKAAQCVCKGVEIAPGMELPPLIPRVFLTLRDSQDAVIRDTLPEVRTGRKWSVSKEVDEMESILKHKEIVGHGANQ